MQRRVEAALEKAFQNHVPLKMGFLFLRKFYKETHQLYGESNVMGQGRSEEIHQQTIAKVQTKEDGR